LDELGVRFVRREALIHLISQVVQLFMLNNAVSEVVLVMEQIVDGDWLEEFSASDVPSEEASTDGNA
jgi:hypothetical protein